MQYHYNAAIDHLISIAYLLMHSNIEHFFQSPTFIAVTGPEQNCFIVLLCSCSKIKNKIVTHSPHKTNNIHPGNIQSPEIIRKQIFTVRGALEQKYTVANSHGEISIMQKYYYDYDYHD